MLRGWSRNALGLECEKMVGRAVASNTSMVVRQPVWLQHLSMPTRSISAITSRPKAVETLVGLVVHARAHQVAPVVDHGHPAHADVEEERDQAELVAHGVAALDVQKDRHAPFALGASDVLGVADHEVLIGMRLHEPADLRGDPDQGLQIDVGVRDDQAHHVYAAGAPALEG